MRNLTRTLVVAFTASAAWAGGNIDSSKKPADSPEVIAIKQTVQSIEVWPTEMSLNGPRDARRVLVTGILPDGARIDLTHNAAYQPTGDGVRFDGGFVVPAKDGEHALKVSVGGRSTTIPVKVAGASVAPPISFVRDVMPVLGSAGCNSGACHGGAKGRNGFMLSLRGYDPAFDHASLVDDLSARRFNRADPDQSLMLLKPSQGVPHEGGLVLDVGSPDYRLVRAWIEQGVKSDVDKIHPCDRIEVRPESSLLPRSDMTQQMVVIAHYPDGTTRDVSRDAVYTSSKPIYVTVDKAGLAEGVRPGEAAILVRYEGRYAMSTVSVLEEKDGFQWQAAPVYNYIDQKVDDKLKRLKVLPSAVCDDATFIRRVYLDMIGIAPRRAEVRAFLQDRTDSRIKRRELVERLMDRPEFVEFWAMRWADLLKCNRKFVGDKGVWSYRNWIRQAVARNKPMDQFARDLLTARGSTFDNPAANFYRVTREPDVMMETVSQLFLGVRIMCAKCHDHPFEPWTQKAYFQLSAYFARVAIKPGQRPGEEVVYENFSGGEVHHPKNNAVMSPHVPFGETGQTAGDRRVEVLADWLTSQENGYFAKSIANRMWGYFFGRGIIDPVDDIRASNPPSNEALLDALTQDFVGHGYDLRHSIRTIVNSRTYQLDVATNKWNRDDHNFSRAEPRRLSAEQLWDSLANATGTKGTFAGVPSAFSATQLPDAVVGNGGFLDLFGRPARESACECERRGETSFAQALSLVNGETIAKAVSSPGGLVTKLVEQKKEPIDMVQDMYLAAVCRMPKDVEVKSGVEHIQSATSPKEGAEDVMWALLNSPEFLFNR